MWNSSRIRGVQWGGKNKAEDVNNFVRGEMHLAISRMSAVLFVVELLKSLCQSGSADRFHRGYKENPL